jgi:alpha-L-fucosidase 2
VRQEGNAELKFLGVLGVLGGSICLFFNLFAAPAFADDLTLWYTQPAKTWMTDALPIGNGQLGGMVFGGIAQEHIQFNEDTLWTGGPAALSGTRPGGAQHIAEIQKLMAAGQIPEATRLIQQYFYGNTRGFGAYQAFGDLLIDLPSGADAATATDYRRELDLEHGVARVHYTINGIRYDRECFCSYSNGVMALHLTASRPGSVNAVVHLPGAQRGTATTARDNELTLTGKLADNGMEYQAVALVDPQGPAAMLTDGPDQIQIQNADAVTILLCASTSYKFPSRTELNPADRNATAIRAANKSYADLLAVHEKEYASLFGRVILDLGHSDNEKLPTDQRLIARAKGANDPSLDALYFQFGRYLLISSSRDRLPSNRQGLWNNATNPQWGADFPTMMNLEMMYWPAETTNLSECAQPLIDMIDALRVPGAVTAKTAYGAGGWTVNYTTNPWGFTAGGTGPYQYFPAGAAWLCQHVWEHYAFTQDRDYLAKTAYPIMKHAAQFWVDHLIADSDGTLVSSPSESPEHGAFAVGAAMDQEIVWDLFTNCVAAADILNTDADFKAKLSDMLKHLSGPKIGSHGQLQEWKADVDDPADTHRHVSHLWAVYPGHQIGLLTTPDLAAAAKKSLESRGDGGPSWGWAWKMGFWARLGDGDHAHLILDHLLTPTSDVNPRSTNAGTYENMFAARPPLQVDGNLAATAAMAEMLVQSQNPVADSQHSYEIDLLPALPKAWATYGSVVGLKARGGFTVDLVWRDGVLNSAGIHSLAGNVCRVRAGRPIEVHESGVVQIAPNVLEFPTTPGTIYSIVPAGTGR